MAGALDRLLEMTVRYANERQQFGQAINRFQAVQQQIAQLAGHTALASAAVGRAVSAPDDLRMVATAKICAGHAAGAASAIAHQVHGAIGFTREHQLHRWTTKLWRWRDDYGSETFWARELGARVMASGADRVWEGLVE
jgi:acyl-CoA dehydrogenase